MLSKFPLREPYDEIQANVTDETTRFVLYDERLPSRLDSLHHGVNPMSRCVFSLVVLTAVSSACFAQDSSTGAIRGTVLDPSGRTIAGASVALANDATGIHFEQTSDLRGRFVFELLPPGDYTARVTADGMSPELGPGIHVAIGGETEITFKLVLAGIHENVTVSAEPRSVETEPRGISAVVDERAIANLPLNGRRFTDLSLLTPGATQDPRGQNSTSNGDLAFGGIRGFHTSYLVDGGDNNNAFFAQARGRYRAPYQFSNEVVQEFRVSSNTYGAELGRAGGAVVNVVTKSGSNHLHGTAFYYLRDSALNAQHPFVDFKPDDRQHQFGFTVGGPIRHNRIFFFGGFDQHAFHVPTVVRFADGSSVVTPQKGQEPLYHGDYEDSDKDIVFA